MRLIKEKLTFLKNRERNYLIFFQFFNAFLSIIFGKLVALHVTPEAFGTFNIQNAAYFFVFSLLLQPFLQYIKSNFQHLKNLGAFSHLLRFYILFVTVSSILIVMIFRLYFNEHFWIILFVVTTLILNSIFMLMNDYFSLRGEFRKISGLNLFKNALPIIFLMVFVFVIGFMPSDGYVLLWWAQIVGFFAALYYVLKWYRLGIADIPAIGGRKLLTEIFIYMGPLMILSFWNWINSYADRFIIEKLLDLKTVGIYNANVGLGSKVFLMIGPLFLTLLTPVVFNPSISLKDRKTQIDRYLKIYIVLILSAGVFIYFFEKPIGMLFLSKAYEDGFFLIFWSCISYGIITAGYFLEMIFYAENKTKIILFANIISAVAVVSINVFFLPLYGLPVAAFALFAASMIKIIYLRFIFSLAS
ncbi:O-antigen/teichoic acid export membrane protein [Chryseobacterium sp. MDT2-18]|nr:O-antigen/teichoic acid export membrane protein [Chryseobacterium sp. MDT2-18]